ncbi:type IV toxin-antitoxin system AbiEi family antitoxin domain-containing protein [Kineococcus sp. NBC_00420]|uniref:type IV toxin-antitoxin system AbiEi family antitoxin domain-containing protein n=1 Tax=Kineococcus sp. NBC_00420 TaxID=2903564 RepID=UPI002E1A48EA
MRTSDLTTVTDLAAGQWGLLTTAQAAQAGINRVQLTRMVTAGVLERVAHGVYATPAVLGDDLLSLRTAWLALQPRASASDRLADPLTAGVVSHTSAAHLHQLGDLLADEHELTLPKRYQSTRAGVRVHRATLTAGEVTLAAGLPVTTPAHTVADLLSAGYDLEHVGQVAADAVRRGSTTPDELAVALHPAAPRYEAADGTALTQRLLDAGGLAPHERPGYDIRLASRLELLRRSLEQSGMHSPSTSTGDDSNRPVIAGESNLAIVATGVITLATLMEEIAADPRVRAAVAGLAQRTRATLAPLRNQLVHGITPAVHGARSARSRLEAALPSPDTQERIVDWFADPDNQAALTQMLTTLQMLTANRTPEGFSTAIDEPAHHDTDNDADNDADNDEDAVSDETGDGHSGDRERRGDQSGRGGHLGSPREECRAVRGATQSGHDRLGEGADVGALTGDGVDGGRAARPAAAVDEGREQ